MLLLSDLLCIFSSDSFVGYFMVNLFFFGSWRRVGLAVREKCRPVVSALVPPFDTDLELERDSRLGFVMM